MRILIFGTDGRMQVAAEKARAAGHTVLPVTRAAELPDPVPSVSTLYLLPIPVSRDGILINGTDIPLSRLVPHEGARLFGGGIPACLRERFSAFPVVDALEDEVFNQINARLTAEGGIAAALKATARGLYGLRATVFGFGRIGRYTAHLLRGFDIPVTVVARRPEVLTEAALLGYGTQAWSDRMQIDTELVFGTVPAHAYDGVALRANALCIDLGGGMPPRFPYDGGEIAVTAARGVPGVFAPLAAGDAVYACLERLFSEDDP